MNISKLQNILEDESLDVIQKIFEQMSEELAYIGEQDKKQLNNADKELNQKFEILKQQFNALKINKQDKIIETLSEYISARDYISAYFNEKYFKERSKNRDKINY